MKTERPQGPKMRKFFSCLLLTSGALLAVLAAYPQGKDVRFSLTAKQIPLKEIIYQIRVQTGLQAFFSNEQINVYQKFDVNFKNAKLDDVLRTLLDAKKFKWYIREEAVVIAIRQQENILDSVQKKKDSILTNRISGVVTNESGIPLVGATVHVKGMSTGTTTDAAGRFTLDDVNPDSRLVVSCVGYKVKELPVKQKHIAVHLETDVNTLDETVIIGYGVTTKRMLTGSVSKITSKEIAQQPVSNPLQALQGRTAGLNIIQITGLPGSDYRVELRGRNSIASGNNPLYIVDGVPFPSTPLTWDQQAGLDVVNPTGWRVGFGANLANNPLNAINPSDIESIEILKDADATAIYGSRGANGVVLISTKKGLAGRTKADINLYTGWGRVGHHIPYLKTPQYLEMRREAFQNDGKDIFPEDYDLYVWDTARYVDWQRAMIGGTAMIRDAQASASGGSTSAQFRVSGGYRKESTVYPGNFNYEKASLRTYIALSSPDQRWKGTLFSSYVSDRNYLLNEDLTRYATLPPNMPDMFDSNGTLQWATGVFDNPYAVALRSYSLKTDNLSFGSLISYEVLPGLQLKASLGYNKMTADEIQINPKASNGPWNGDVKGFSHFANSSIKTWIIEPQASYQRSLGRGRLELLIGATFQQNIRDQKGFLATGYNDDSKMEDITAAAEIDNLPGSNYSFYRYNAAFGRINYNWADKYIVNLTGRRDGSSRFSPGRQFANFGAVGAAWIFSKEQFMHVPALSFGKLRLSYGITGNDQISDNENIERYVPGPNYQGQSTLYNDKLFNPWYGWERNRKLELGLELGFLQDRFFLRANYYNNRSSNQLVKYPLSGVTGFTTVMANIPAIVANRGLEMEIKTVNLRNRSFTWTSSINMTFPRNRLLAFPGLELTTYKRYFTIGRPLDQFKGFHYTGVDTQTGVYQFEDVNGDGKLNPLDDFKGAKSLTPLFYGGIQNSLTWKGWQLDFLVQMVKQNGYNYEYVPDVFLGPGAPINQPVGVMKAWRKPGDRTNIQQFTQSVSSPAGHAYLEYTTSSDKLITDASFIRLKSLNLSYQLPEKLAKRWHVPESRFYIQGQNLITITNYPGRDPENAALPNANSYPPLRVWTAGLQLSF